MNLEELKRWADTLDERELYRAADRISDALEKKAAGEEPDKLYELIRETNEAFKNLVHGFTKKVQEEFDVPEEVYKTWALGGDLEGYSLEELLMNFPIASSSAADMMLQKADEGQEERKLDRGEDLGVEEVEDVDFYESYEPAGDMDQFRSDKE